MEMVIRSSFKQIGHERVTTFRVHYPSSSCSMEGYTTRICYLGSIHHYVVISLYATLKKMFLLMGEGMLGSNHYFSTLTILRSTLLMYGVMFSLILPI